MVGNYIIVMKDRNPKGQFIKGKHPSPATEFKKGEHWRNPKPHWDREWLNKEYSINKRSAADIALEMNCTENNILYWLKKHSIPRRDISETRAIKYWGLKGKANGMYGRINENNPNWRGGITPDRQAFYSSRKWAKVCSDIWKRDQAKCRRCGKMNKNSQAKFHIHHIVSFEVKALRAEPSNLVLLCARCHHFVHSKKNVKKQFIKENTLDL